MDNAQVKNFIDGLTDLFDDIFCTDEDIDYVSDDGDLTPKGYARAMDIFKTYIDQHGFTLTEKTK
jgi:hypothetical protein